MNYESGMPERRDLGMTVAEMTTEEAVEFLRKLASETDDGGEVIITVPDFDRAVELYRAGSPGAEKACVDGGRFKSIWNRAKLLRLLDAAGFCAAGPASGTSWEKDGTISIVARKYWRMQPPKPLDDILAIMSLPRVAWTTTMGCLHESCSKLGIDAVRSTGVFWGQCIERMLEQTARDGHKYALTVDYDSIFDANDIVRLWQIMESNPDIDVLCPLQIQRDKPNSLFCIMGSDGKLLDALSEERLLCEAIDIYSGHFGLTLIRCSALEGIKRPLFWGQPDADGSWGKGRTDDDIFFWNRLREAGRRVCLTPRVRIGHLQLVVSWPDESFEAMHQYHPAYIEEGRPKCTMTF